jgi:FkbM family methyltransferase
MKNIKLILKNTFPGLVYKYLIYKNPSRKYKFELFKKHDINCILDVGANIGLYAHAIRHSGYYEEIISFEPLLDAFNKLEELSSKDQKWTAHNYGLGDFDGETQINISSDSVSSSLLDKTTEFDEMFPEMKNIKKESIKIRKLDTIYDDICSNKNVFLKLDTQGFEKNIIDGGIKSIKKIKGIQLELSVKQLYDNEAIYVDMLKYMSSLGFELKAIEDGWYKDNEIVQFDGIFFRK